MQPCETNWTYFPTRVAARNIPYIRAHVRVYVRIFVVPIRCIIMKKHVNIPQTSEREKRKQKRRKKKKKREKETEENSDERRDPNLK